MNSTKVFSCWLWESKRVAGWHWLGKTAGHHWYKSSSKKLGKHLHDHYGKLHPKVYPTKMQKPTLAIKECESETGDAKVEQPTQESEIMDLLSCGENTKECKTKLHLYWEILTSQFIQEISTVETKSNSRRQVSQERTIHNPSIQVENMQIMCLTKPTC